MQDHLKYTVVTSKLRSFFMELWRRYRVIYFGAPFGFGKTTAAQLLLRSHTNFMRNGDSLDMSAEPIPTTCMNLMIDDIHMLKDEQQQQAVCSWINENPKRHLIVLGRGMLPNWLIPYQVTGMLVQINSTMLSLDRDAIQEMLMLHNISLPNKELNALVEDSKGYPLIVSILCRLLANGRHYDETVADEARRESFFVFETYVYERFEIPMRQLLIGLAPFETFDAELAKIVSGNNQVNELIAQLRHETSMVLFDGIDTYHFWPLFRRFLQWEMQQACTVDQQNEIYRRAGLYYELHEDYPHALDCFSKSGDHYKVSDLLVKNAQKHSGEANFYELEKYYNALPREDILRSSTLMCGMSMLSAICMDYETSDQWYEELKGYTTKLKKTDAEYKKAKSQLLYLDIALPQKGSKNLIEILTNTYKAMKEKDMLMPSFSVTSCMPSIMNGGKDFCEWSKMDDLLYKTMRVPVEAILGKDGIGLADCAICESKFEKGEDVTSLMFELMSQTNDIERKGTPDLLFASMGLLARIQTIQGKPDAALATLEHIRSEMIDKGETRFLPNIDAMKCRLWLRTGNQKDVEEWLNKSAPLSLPPFRTLWRYRYMTKTMAQIAYGSIDDALISMAPFDQYCKKCGRVIDGIYLNVLQAVCHYRQKNDSWQMEMTKALDTAYTYRFITPIAEFGAAVQPMLAEMTWTKNKKYLEQLIVAVRQQTVYYPDFLRPAVRMEEKLTPAELQVLRLLCSNRSNQEIAEILGVKLPTVKTQVRSILQKLGVKKRSEARDAAIQLHLI